MMTAARTAFLAYVNRFNAWAQGAAERLVKALADDAPGYGQPEVVVTADGIAEIRLYAFIESHFMCELYGLPGSMAVSDVGFARALDAAKATGKPARLRINSGGGDVFAGVAMANMVREAKVAVFIDGNAASIATVIAAASPHVTMLPGTTMMVHNPWSCIGGNARAFRTEADILDKLRDSMVEVYVGKTGSKADAAKWRALLDGAEGADGTWLSAGQCMELGLADSAPRPDEDKATAALVEQRQLVATYHGVTLPKNLAEMPGRADPQNPIPPAPGADRGAIAAGERVSHRPGAFRIRTP